MDNNLPPGVVATLNKLAFNHAELLGKHGKETVYGLSLLDESGLPMPTGLPVLVLVFGSKYRVMTGERALKLQITSS